MRWAAVPSSKERNEKENGQNEKGPCAGKNAREEKPQKGSCVGVKGRDGKVSLVCTTLLRLDSGAGAGARLDPWHAVCLWRG